MLQIPIWKRVLIWAVCLAGIILAMPNLFYGQVERHNDAAAVVEAGATLTPEQQAAFDGWPDWLPGTLVNLGLDLRGGAHLLAEVRVSDVYAQRMDGYWPEDSTELVVGPLFCADFDALELIETLGKSGYRGQVRIMAPKLPNRQIVLRELRSHAVRQGITLELAEPG